MAKGSGGTRISSPGVEIKVRPSKRRMANNQKWAEELAGKGYSVEWPDNGGAFYAVYGETHLPHERDVVKILAENGISASLDREGMTVRIKGRKYTIPAPDGTIERGYSHEIYALNGKPDISKVAEGISHSFKPFHPDPKQNIQSQIAITYTPQGTQYTDAILDAGVKEFIRQRKNGETAADPRFYINVDAERRKVYYRKIK